MEGLGGEEDQKRRRRKGPELLDCKIEEKKRLVKLTVVKTGLVFFRRKKELCVVLSILVFSYSVIFNSLL